MSESFPAGPIAVIAGGGCLPAEVAEAARASGREVVVFRIADEADHPVGDGVESHTLHFGQIGRLFAMLAERGCRDLVFVGAIRRRPTFSAVASDFGTLRRLPRIVRALSGGDDSVIRKSLSLIEREGYHVLPIAEVAPTLLATAGRLGSLPMPDREASNLALGRECLAAMSPFDVGQAVAVVERRIVAVEGAEGTDAMLARVADLRRAGRVRAARRRGILVKMTKRAQDLRTDLPVIGADTVRLAADADLAGIAVEADRAIVAQRPATIAAADRAGLFLFGIAAE